MAVIHVCNGLKNFTVIPLVPDAAACGKTFRRGRIYATGILGQKTTLFHCSVEALTTYRTFNRCAIGANFKRRTVRGMGEKIIAEALRRQNFDELLSVADRVEGVGIPPMSAEELNAEIQAYRMERRPAGV